MKKNNFSIKFSFSLLLFFLFSFPLTALDPNKPLHLYQLDEWQISHGIPNNWITAIAQTPDGYLWIGTYAGLVKYDGIRFHMIEKIADEDLTDRSIFYLYVDKPGNLWIATRFGLVRYKDERFKVFNKTDGLSSEDVDCVMEDMHGDIWVGTSNGKLNCLKDGKFIVFDTANGLGPRAISSILEDSRGNLWVGANAGGLFYGQKGKFTKYDFNIKNLEDYSVFELCEDKQGNIWVGTNRGLIRIKDKKSTIYTLKDGLANINIPVIFEDSDGNLWVGTGNGINRLREKEEGKIAFEHYLAGHVILYFFEDREKSLWIATEDAGLKRLKDSTFKTLYREAGIPGFKSSIFETRDGDIRIGSHVGGLYRFNNGTANLLLKLGFSREMGIRAIEQDSKGNLWLGTGRGLFMVKGKKAVKYSLADSSDLLRGNFIRVLYYDSRNILWIGTSNGLKSYYNSVTKSYTTKDGLADNEVLSITEDRKHNLWVGTQNGLNVLEKDKGNDNLQKKYLVGTYITDIHEDESDDVFWIGALYKGLARFKNGRFVFYTKENGLPGKFIYQIIEDGRGNLWMSSDKGVIKVSKCTLNEFADGTVDEINCTLYGISDGLKTNQCSYGTRNSIIKTRSGELWFSTLKGIAVVHPGKIKMNKIPPPIIIKKVLFNYDPISKKRSGSAFKGITDIRFTFTAPTFISPGKIKFKFKLEGCDKEWTIINAFKERTAVYKRLPFGSYSFKVSACNSDQIWNKTGTSFDFTLKPYFYQTLLFKIAAGLFVVFLLAGFFIAYRKYRELKKLREKYKGSTLDKENAESYRKKLMHLLEVEKVFLDEEVSLQSLSGRLSISTRNLSQVINEHMNMNFCDLINNYRIEEAKRIFSEPKQNDYSILEIAFQVGFNSKASFYRAFRKHTGMTPSQFREKLKN